MKAVYSVKERKGFWKYWNMFLRNWLSKFINRRMHVSIKDFTTNFALNVKTCETIWNETRFGLFYIKPIQRIQNILTFNPKITIFYITVLLTSQYFMDILPAFKLLTDWFNKSRHFDFTISKWEVMASNILKVMGEF